ncbi:MAG: YggS family pyridoxal phosphate-dependent enzyme [Caldisericia bacterium]|nr:YggS family pyridoxal phosphate-dependent enzyme [Caldisericia bacterium]
MENKKSISEAILEIRDRVIQTAKRVLRNPEEITIMAVSKNASVQDMEEAFRAGITLFGENRIQHALPKIQFFHSHTAFQSAEFQFIGHLQTNKMNKIIPAFSAIQSVTDSKLVEELHQRVPSYLSPYPILLEVKTSSEEYKLGWQPEDLIQEFGALMGFSSVNIIGLMTIAPFVEEESLIRGSFRTLRETKETLEKKYSIPLPVLSMGMSRDYTIAIEEGSNMLRIGNAIFGG